MTSLTEMDSYGIDPGIFFYTMAIDKVAFIRN